MKTVKKAFAIYRIDSFQTKTPMGPREVRLFTKESEIQHELPEEIISQLDNLPVNVFNQAQIFEGTGQVLVQTPRGVFPQPINFLFDSTVQNIQQAFERFDEHMEAEVQRLQSAQQQQPNIQTASADQLRAIEAAQRRSPGGIITP